MMTISHQLEAEDLMRLTTEDAPRVAAPILQRLRASHHAAARHLATGKSIRETAILVGRTPQRIGDLTRDPAFQELMHYYNDQKAEVSITDSNRIQEKLVEMAELATDELLDRLEDPVKVAALPAGELRQIAAMGLDRTVAPPKTAIPGAVVPTQITFNMGTRDLRPQTIIDHQTTVLIEEGSTE